MMGDSTGAYEPYQPPESLWQFIKSIANEKELDVIKNIIGESLVEMSLDLHNEIDSLLEIWRDYRNETMVTLNKIKQDSVSSKTSNLPEPPNIRETLKQEIRLFVTQMREHFKNDESKFCRQILANEHNLGVINYVLNVSSSNETVYDLKENERKLTRPKSARRPDTGVETPVSRQSRVHMVRYRSQSVMSTSDGGGDNGVRFNASRLRSLSPSSLRDSRLTATRRSAIDEQIEFIVDEDKLNSMQIDDIVDNLRDMFQKECDQLLIDIDFLYECIYDESDYRHKSRETMHEPSLNELKEERKKLESDLMSATGKNQLHISKLPSNVSKVNHNRSIHSPLMNQKVTPSPPSSATRSMRSTPTTTTTNSYHPTNISSTTINRTPTTTTITPLNALVKRSSILNKPADISVATRRNSSEKTTDPVITNNNRQMIMAANGAVKSSKALLNKTTVNHHDMGGLNSTGSSLSNESKQIRSSSRPDSASSIDSSISSSSSSNRVNSAQKFRQMVFEWRD